MCIERKTSLLYTNLKNKHFPCQEGLTLNAPAVHIRSIGLLRWPWLFGEECSWEGKFLMCELREGMWCDCASFLLITCSQNAVWAACRNKSLNTGACVVKTILLSCEFAFLQFWLEMSTFVCMCVYWVKGRVIWGWMKWDWIYFSWWTQTFILLKKIILG